MHRGIDADDAKPTDDSLGLWLLLNGPAVPESIRRGTMAVPVTRYAKSGDVHIAYQVFGGGATDLAIVPRFISHIENDWEHPTWLDGFFVWELSPA